MNTIQALIDAEKKATEGPWTLDHDDTAVAGPIIDHDWAWIVLPHEDDPDSHGIEYDRCKEWRENNQFIAAARNAMPEIMELVALNRKVFARGRTVSEDDINRIREIVGEK